MSPLLHIRYWVLVWRLQFPCAHQMDRDSHTSNQEPPALSLSEGKYICHSYCQDLVHLDYPQNGKLPSGMPICEVRHSSQNNPQVGATQCLQCFKLGIVPSLECQQNGLLTPMAYLCVFTSANSCLSFAMTPFFCCIRSLTVGCDPRNNRIECANSLCNRFWERCKVSICTIVSPRLGWGLADRRTHCQLTMGLELWTSVLVVSISDKQPQHEHSIQESIIFLLVLLKPGSPNSWSRSTFDRSSAWFLADLPPHCFPWFVEISRRMGVPPAVKPTPLLPWLFLASSLLTFQDFSLKIVFPPHPRKLWAVALNDPRVSCWFLGAHFHVWIGLLKSGNDIHLSFTCVWSHYSVWGQETDSVQPPDQCWAQKNR